MKTLQQKLAKFFFGESIGYAVNWSVPIELIPFDNGPILRESVHVQSSVYPDVKYSFNDTFRRIENLLLQYKPYF